MSELYIFHVFFLSVVCITGEKNSKRIEFILKTTEQLFSLNPDANVEKLISVGFASENLYFQTCFKTIKPIGTLKCGWSFSLWSCRINFLIQ